MRMRYFYFNMDIQANDIFKKRRENFLQDSKI